MLHERLLEIVARYVELLDRVREEEMDFDDVLKFYAVLHALQIHAQAAADYLLHTCAVLGDLHGDSHLLYYPPLK